MSSPGRLEIVRRGPVIILDSAHNPAGMAASAAALTEVLGEPELIGVIAVSGDKDVEGILAELEPVTSQLVVTGNSSPRSMDPAKLADVAAGVFGEDRVRVADRLDQALEVAVTLADEAAAASGSEAGPAILVTGSVITAGDARILLGPGQEQDAG
jgi:dihydrofolate synthase/folylpolyglutamate synthase